MKSHPYHFIPSLFLGVFLFVSGVGSPVRAQDHSLAESLQQVDILLNTWNTSTPGAALSISKKGQVIYKKAFGMADLEHNVINTTETIFEAGSVSKQFTAAAVLLLVRDGKIGLQDDIRKYFPDFPDYGTPITVEHLLHHISGLRDWGAVISFSGWPRGSRTYTPAQVKAIIWRQKGLNFAPGSAYGYSNSNYNLLGFLVEKVSGQSLQDFTQEKLFTPAGMSHTRWRDNFKTIVPNRAIAYSKNEGVFEQNMPFENTFGHGALLTTIGDLEKWNRRWTLLTFGEELNKLQRAKVKLNNGREIGYAAGVGLGTVNGITEISHSGATAGYRAWMAYYPEEELSVVFLSNDGDANPSGIGGAIAKIFLGESKSTPPTAPKAAGKLNLKKEQLASFAGMYKNIWGEELQELEFSKDSLRFKSSGKALVPVSANMFFNEGLFITFPENTSHPENLLFRTPRGDTATYRRVMPFNPDETALKTFTGAYDSQEAGAEVSLILEAGQLWIVWFGDEKILLKPTFTDAFFDEDLDLFQFMRDKQGKVIGFSASVPRARGVWFAKRL